MSNSSSQGSKRKWAPKSKLGCNTCKSRHVRCNNLQPRCTPCLKSSRQCSYSTTPQIDPLKIVLYQPNPSLNTNNTTEELRAFEFFKDKVAARLGGIFDDGFWTGEVLKVAMQEDSIRHGIVALSSLSETMLNSSSNPSGTFARRHYTMAMAELKGERCLKDEVVLITCALFICIEMFQGNWEMALNHMVRGVYLSFKSRPRVLAQSPRSLGILQVQLERMFGRLMLQAILFVDTKPSDWKFVAPSLAPRLPEIPVAFSSVIEARNCLDACLSFLLHRILVSQFQGLNENLPRDPTPEAHIDPLCDWLCSFTVFKEQHVGTFSPQDEKAAILLAIQHITSTTLASPAPFSQEMMFDSVENEFSRVNTLASHLFAISPPQGDNSIPSFEMGILPQLYFVSSRCRHPIIRRQALALLRRGPEQEGIWHRDMLVSISEKIINMEEMGIESVERSADVEVGKRISVVNAKIDSKQRKVTLHCCRQQTGKDEGLEVFHELVEY